MNPSLKIIGLLVIFSLLSCEKLFMQPEPDNSPLSVFEQVWQFTNDEYSFFEYKEIDWNTVYEEFRPKISEQMSDEALFDVLAEMLFRLRDGHVNLKAPFDRSRNWQWFLDYPANYDYTLLQRNYFNNQEQYVGPFVVVDFEDVGYVHYQSFGSSISEYDLDYIFEKFSNHKGLIIDVRNNGGGYISGVYALGNRIVEQKTAVALQCDKNGPGHTDFTDKYKLYLQPAEGKTIYTKPIVVLTNRLCYSATNFLVTMIRELPQVTILGDRTGGGGGTPAFTELSNGWTLRVSSTQLFTLDGVNVESGIDPDIEKDMDEADRTDGIDTILEAALELLRR